MSWRRMSSARLAGSILNVTRICRLSTTIYLARTLEPDFPVELGADPDGTQVGCGGSETHGGRPKPHQDVAASRAGAFAASGSLYGTRSGATACLLAAKPRSKQRSDDLAFEKPTHRWIAIKIKDYRTLHGDEATDLDDQALDGVLVEDDQLDDPRQ
jgi:hypothetical protein